MIILDDWLTKVTGLKIGTLVLKHYETVVLGEHDFSFLQSKVPLEHVNSISQIKNLGFRLVDINLTFSLENPNSLTETLVDYQVRKARPDDICHLKHLQELGVKCLYSRFNLDTSFSANLADKIKEEWIKSLILGSRGAGVCLCFDKERVVGFIGVVLSSSGMVIDLIFINPDYNGKGIAQRLIEVAVKEFNIQSNIIVGTQATNTRAIGFYQKLGFHLISEKGVFHKFY